MWGGCVCLVEAERAESRRGEPRGAPGTWAGLSFLLADVDAEICGGVAWGVVLPSPRWEGGAQHCSQSPLPLHPPHREGPPQAAAGLAGVGSCILS